MTSMAMGMGVADILAADHQSTMRKNAERARLVANLDGARPSGLRAAVGNLLIRAGSRMAGRKPAAALNRQPARA